MARLHRTSFWRASFAGAAGIALGASALVVRPLADVAAAAPLTFTVTTTSNVDDPTPDGVCNGYTLREAMQEANAHPTGDTAVFSGCIVNSTT